MRYRNFSLVLALILQFPMSARAIPAITCHCFTDRTFEPDRPAAADPYFLATVQNSFMAVIFSVDKKNIVMKKQQGTSSDDLWIAYWVAYQTASSADALLQKKASKGLWKNVFPAVKSLGSRFSSALNSNSSPALLAEIVVDEQIARNKLLNATDVAALRQAGASNQELIIAAVISARTRQPARHVYLDVKNGSKTWGALLTSAKIDTKNVQREISSLLNVSSASFIINKSDL